MFSAVLFLFSTDIVVNLKKQKINKYVTVLLFILYSKWVHVENPKYKIICLKSQTSSEFAKKNSGQKSYTMFISSCFNNYSIDF